MSVSTKVVRVFVFAFLGAFLAGLSNALLDISSTAGWSVWRAALVSLIVASLSAAIRAAVAFLPVLPDDDVGIRKG